jgi:hypothetical protein
MDSFGTILIVIVVVGVIVAVISYIGSGALYSGIGRAGGLSLDEPDLRPGPRAGTPAARAEADEEIRQMVEAKNVRRAARGEAPLDVDAEIASLTAPAPGGGQDQALREEVRQLVVARNERRARQGRPPLDVEEEIDRQLRELGA